MKVTQEKLPDSQLGLEIEIPAETSQKVYNTNLQNVARNANIPGFRKGKVPRQVVVQKLGLHVKAVTLEELIKSSLSDAIEQEAIESLGNYQLKTPFEELVEQFTPGNAFTFSAIIEVPPIIQLGDYSSLSVQAEEVPYNPEEVENWFKERQEKLATLIPVEDRAADWEDVAIIDYQAYEVTETGEKGEAIADIKDTDFKVNLKSGTLVEGMVEGIVGMQAEEAKEITVTFPKDYPMEQVAGKPVLFEITLKELKAKELPELDDDFAEEVSEFETLEELKTSLEKEYREEAEEATNNNIDTAIVNELVKISEVEIPESLVQEEITQVLRETLMRLEQMGIDPRAIFTQDNIPQLRDNARSEAVQRLKQNLILKQVAQSEAIAVADSEIQERSNEIRSRLSGEKIDLERLRAIVTEELTAEKTLEALQEKVKVELVPQGTLTPPEEAEEAAANATVEAEAVEVTEEA
ncbi:MAG: trigger factor [Snowella sp.]|nr:trigger factor [Snowella sp.]